MAPTATKRGLNRGMGSSRGGNTMKLHAFIDRNGLPVALKLTEGQAHDSKARMNGIGELLPCISPSECANGFRNSERGST